MSQSLKNYPNRHPNDPINDFMTNLRLMFVSIFYLWLQNELVILFQVAMV